MALRQPLTPADPDRLPVPLAIGAVVDIEALGRRQIEDIGLGSGGQRAVHALLNGDVAGAFRFNALLMIAVPWMGLCLFAESRRTRNPRLYARLNPELLMWLFLALTVSWWLLRNFFDW